MKADALLLSGDAGAAESIYRVLLERSPETADDFLLIGLAASRCGELDRALDTLERGLQQHPGVTRLTDNYLLVCAHQKADRALRVLEPNEGLAACKRLLGREGDWGAKVSLIAYCVKAGFGELANTGIEQIIDSSADAAALWRLSDILLELGRKPDAFRIYRRLSEEPAAGADTALLHCLSHERLGAPDKAITRIEADLIRYPAARGLREHLLRILVAMGRIDRASVLLGRSLDDEATLDALFEAIPDVAQQAGLFDHCIARGNLAYVRRRLEDAARAPVPDVRVRCQVAQSLAARGYTSEAREILESLAATSHDNAASAHLVAASLNTLGSPDLALAHLEDALRAFPTDADIRLLYLQICSGLMAYERYALTMKGRSAPVDASEAIVFLYRSAIDADAIENFILNYNNLRLACEAGAFRHLVDYALSSVAEKPPGQRRARAQVFYGRYIDLDDDFASRLARVLEGDAQGVDGAPERHRLRILDRMTVPLVFLGRQPLESYSQRFTEQARQLADVSVELVEPIADLDAGWTPWVGLFCSGAMQDATGAYARAMRSLEEVAIKTWPRLAHTAPHIAHPRGRLTGRRIRLGIVVNDTMPMMSGLLRGLDPEHFETVLLHPGLRSNTRAADDWALRVDRVVSYPSDAVAAIEAISAEELDIIVSGPSLPATLLPMVARLAHLQIVLLEPNWSDGFRNSDYYVSWGPAEPVNLHDFYRSSVALLRHPPYFIERPQVSAATVDGTDLRRRLFGARADQRIYLCPNTPPKIHPDMDEAFRELLSRDPQGVVVFLRSDYPPVRTLKARLLRSLGERLTERLVFLPTLSQADAHTLLLAVDACIDSFPLCGMSSSFDAAMLGVPTVTLPADAPFGKWTAAMYDYIGVTGLTAKSREEYVEIAIRLAKDHAWRAQLGAELRAKAERFIESRDSVAEFAAFIDRAWQRHVDGLPPADWIDDAWMSPAGGVDQPRDLAEHRPHLSWSPHQ